MSTAPQVVAGNTPDAVSTQPALPQFSDAALGFLKGLSSELLGNPRYRSHPGLVALGFWLRPAALDGLRRGFTPAPDGYQRIAAGTVLHLTPGNVDNLFAYAWAISLLCGNADIIRLSSQPSTERELLLELIRRLVDTPAHAAVAARTSIIRYGHDDAVTIELSTLADRRVIWGGDATVAHLRGLPAPALCQDILFPDRHSASLLSAHAVVERDELAALIEAFYRDAYGFDQMACSSPRLLLWLGTDDDVAAAQARFWPALARFITHSNPAMSEALLMDKLVALQSMALSSVLTVLPTADQRLHVARLDAPDETALAKHCGGGLFLEAQVLHATDITRWLPPHTQTLTHWGLDSDDISKLNQVLADDLPDRLVPVGQALNFELVWDGMSLSERLSRLVRHTDNSRATK